jgi:hypothetical protein
VFTGIRTWFQGLLRTKAKRAVRYVDLGYTSAVVYLQLEVLPTYSHFRKAETRENAIAAAQEIWHLCEWYWHDSHPGEDTLRSKKYRRFVKSLCQACPELRLIQDIAESNKHRGLSRGSVVVKGISGVGSIGGIGDVITPLGTLTGPHPSTLALVTYGKTYKMDDVLRTAVDFWKAKLT